MCDVIPIVRHGSFMHAQERVWRAAIREERTAALCRLSGRLGNHEFAEFQNKQCWSRDYFNRGPRVNVVFDYCSQELALERTNWYYQTLEEAFHVKWLVESFESFQIRVKS